MNGVNISEQDEDPRLACAVLRPMKSEVDTFLSYYLTENDDAALSFIDARISVPPYEVPPNSVSNLLCIACELPLLTYLS